MFAVFFLAIAGILLTAGLEYLFTMGSLVPVGLSIMPVVPYAGAAIMVAGLCFFFVRRTRGVAESGKIITSFLVIGAGLAVLVAGVALNQLFPEAFGMIYVFICSLTVLYLIKYIFQPEFFAVSLLCVIACFGFYAIYRVNRGNASIFVGVAPVMMIIAALGVAAIACFAHFVLRKNNGVLKLGKHEFRIFPAVFSYRFIYIVLACILLGLIATMIFGFQGAYYLMFAMLALEFGLAIYFTAQLM